MFKRLIYLLMVALIVFATVSSGIVPTGSDGAFFPGGPFQDSDTLKRFLAEKIRADTLREYSDYLTSMSHMSGSAGDLTLARFIERKFKAYGLRPVELGSQTSFLTFPNETESSMQLRLLGDSPFEAHLWESSVYEHPRDAQKPTRPYIALSRGGRAEGPVIYANYGTKDDFAKLKELGVETEGAIVFMKYGKMAPGLKIMLAETAGASAVVLFAESGSNDKGFPEGPGLPDGGVQRGNAAIAAMNPGDILTPGWSSAANDRILEDSMVKNVPNIPSIPVSWDNARPFLQALKGHGKKVDYWKNAKPEVDEWWTGDGNGPKGQLVYEPVVRERHAVWNVMTKIEGVEQAEKAIVIGAQRDAFCYGASEAMSGTTILLELARVFALLNYKLGWRPLRSIYFASWDGSEQNYAGSTEWVEFNSEELRREGVIYFNLNSAIAGHELKVSGTPLLDGVLKGILDQVQNPSDHNSTLGDVWGDKLVDTFKEVGDYLPFQSHVGIASVDVSFGGLDRPKHSCFDSIEWMRKFGDPSLEYHKALTNVLALLLLKYSDEPMIDFDVRGYAGRMQGWIGDLEKYAKGSDGWQDNLLDFNPLVHGATSLLDAAVNFDTWFREWRSLFRDGEPPVMMVHRLGWNSRLSLLEKDLMDRNGLPDRNWFKHTIIGPQLWHPTDGQYEWYTFPGIRDDIERQDWRSAQTGINNIGNLLKQAATKFVE